LLIHETAKIDRSLTGFTPKDCIFRIFRDVRFSKDKSPYKTNFGAFLSPGGRKSAKAGYYLHIEPGGSFIAAGIYMPPSDVLRAIRKDIVEHYEEYIEILEDPELKSHFGEVSGDQLKTPPRGFDKDFEGIEHLKFKTYTLMKSRNDDEIRSADSFNAVIEHFRAASPFVKFLNEAAKNAV
jgi:uncharacterized protein (TIGR02453 family)